MFLDYDVNVNEGKWKRHVDAKIRALGMRIDGTKMKLLVAVIVILPRSMVMACTPKNIRSGFLSNGMIDSTSNSVPDCLMCLETLRVPFFKNTDTYEDKKEYVRRVTSVI